MDNNKYHSVLQSPPKKTLSTENPTGYKASGINQNRMNQKELQSKSYRNSEMKQSTYKSPYNLKNTKTEFNDILLNEKIYLQENNKQTSELKKNLKEENGYSSRRKRYVPNEDILLSKYRKHSSQTTILPRQNNNSTKNNNKNLSEKSMYTINKNKSFREKYVTPRKLIMRQEQPIFFLQNMPESKNTITNLSEISTSSLICTAINYKGEPVKINNQLVTDKFILSCEPTNAIIINNDTSNEESYLIQEKNIINTKSPGKQGFKNFCSEKQHPQSYVSYNKHYKDHILLPGEPQCKNVGTHNPHDSLQLNEDNIDTNPVYHRQIQNYYGESYINAECQKYFSKFRCFLWALLIDSVILTVSTWYTFFHMFIIKLYIVGIKLETVINYYF